MMPDPISIEQSGAFVDAFTLEPSASGPLDGWRFGVKDLIDIAGRPTGCGNPSWRDTHPPAVAHAVCVEQLLSAGATCVGKTVTDEMAFSLLGENHFYGTPLNPAAPTRIPGGSSSGSASAVACGLADLALGTDTGGSVRVPASNCGIWGLRPTHGRISVAGVNPFAPGFDTVGILAASGEILERAAGVLLGASLADVANVGTIHVLVEAFDLVDADVRQALAGPVEQLRRTFGRRVRESTIEEIWGTPSVGGFDEWLDNYCVLQWAEIESALGSWIADARPDFGPATAASFNLVHTLDRGRVAAASQRREQFFRRTCEQLGPADLICLPTVPAAAPLKGAAGLSRTGAYYRRALSLTSLAGHGRLPQVSLPLAKTTDSPVGLSLIGSGDADMLVIAAARRLV